MSWKPDHYAELRRFLRRNRPEEEVDEELRHHIEMRVADNISRGMTHGSAVDDAQRRFGDYTRIMDETTRIDRMAIEGERRMEIVDTVVRDVRQAFRSIIRRPGFSVVAIATLALGVGGATAILALTQSIILNPLPYAASERLVNVSSSVPGLSADGEWGVSVAGYFHFAKEQRSFVDVGAYTTDEVNIITASGAERVSAAVVTSSLLNTLGARAQLGRIQNKADDTPSAERTIVLSHAYWKQRYGGANVIGRTIRLNGEPAEIIGIMREGFGLPDAEVDVWLSLGLDPLAPPQNSHFLSMIAQLRPGVTIEAARSDLARLTSQFPSVFPGAYSARFMTEAVFATKVVPLKARVVGDSGRVLWPLLIAVFLVLLIACANVANLFLVRADSSRREIALLDALGASRGRLALHYVGESVVLSMTACAAALVLARVGLRAVVASAPPGIPRLNEVSLGGHAVLFAVSCCLSAGVIFGILPLVRGAPIFEALRDGGRTTTAPRSRHRLRSALIVSQVALSLLLLSGAGLMLRSFHSLLQIDPGFDPAGALTFEIALPRSTYDSHAKDLAFFRALTTKLEAVPGVTTVGVGNYVPLRGDRGCGSVYFQGPETPATKGEPCVFVATAAPGYFEAMGFRVRGRTLSWRDADVRSDAVLVTEAFARRFWPGEDALGKGVGPRGGTGPYYHVAGVVEAARADALGSPDVEGVFYPVVAMEGALFWGGAGATTVIVRTGSSRPLSLVPSLRKALAEVDAAVPLANPRTLDQVVARSMQITTFTMLLLAVAATMSLLLSAVGLYGVISYIATQRRTEMGIRIALGARASDVRALVVRQSMVLTIAGVVIGLAVSAVASQGLASLLYGVHATDPVTLGAVTALLIAVAGVASWVPASRAARVQPMRVLREE